MTMFLDFRQKQIRYRFSLFKICTVYDKIHIEELSMTCVYAHKIYGVFIHENKACLCVLCRA